MVEAIKGAKTIFFWSTFLLLLIMVTACLVLQQVAMIYIEDLDQPLEKRMKMYKFFGTFTRGLVSMSELTMGNYIVILRMFQEDVSEWMGGLLLVYKISVSFGLISIIRGVFMQEVFKVTQSNDLIMVMQKERMTRTHTANMTKLFKDADESGDGYVTVDEFENIMGDRDVKVWLAAQEVTAPDPVWLFNHIADGDDAITAAQMVAGIGRLKGAARGIDLKMVEERIVNTHRLVETLLRRTAALSGQIVQVENKDMRANSPHLDLEI